ncbi:hypothetical protein H5410_031267, partial [Solanum commersonii]
MLICRPIWKARSEIILLFLWEERILMVSNPTKNCRKNEMYLVNGLYYPGESYKTRSYYEEILISLGSVEFQHFSCMGHNPHKKSYNFSKIIIKQIISIEDWGISSMKERQI